MNPTPGAVPITGTGDFFFEMSTDACAVLEYGCFIRANRAWATSLGRPSDELIGRHWHEVIDLDDVDRVSASIAAAAAADGRFSELEARVRRRDGSIRWLVLSGYTDSGRWLLSARDVTEQRESLEKIRRQAHLLDTVDAAVFATDLDEALIEWNTAAERMSGWTRDEAMGRSINAVVVTPGDQAKAAEIIEAVKREGRWEGQFDVLCKDGSTFPALIQATLFTDQEGNPSGMVGVAVDLTERVEDEHKLKAANDFMRAVAESMGEALYTLDKRGRLTYVNPSTEELLGWKWEELVGRVAHEVFHHQRPDGSPYPADECSPAAALGSAEPALVEDDLFIRKDGSEVPVAYTAAPFTTEAGPQGLVVVVRDISERKAKERELAEKLGSMSWVGRIQDAFEQDRFRVYAQPIVSLKTGATLGHELLIRMLGQDGSIILPGRFLPAAEEYLSIRDIDDWMIEQAARIAASGYPVSVNVSAQSVVAAGTSERLRSTIGESGADPSLISLEITETAFVTDDHAAALFVERVGKLGCSVALDDFGTGYGGFSYLKRLPVDYLKIDREFVGDLIEDDASRHVVEAIVSLAQGFGQRTIAEGAEDEATLDELRKLGVDYVQGFAMARPRPASEVFVSRASMLPH